MNYCGDTFELQQDATTYTSTLVHGKTWFALPKTEKEIYTFVVEARKNSVVNKTQIDIKYCTGTFIFNNIHELFTVFLYTLALATHSIIMSSIFNNVIV